MNWLDPGIPPCGQIKVKFQFLADRTNGRPIDTVLRPSSSAVVVCLSVTLCIESKSYYWEPIGSRIWEIDWYQNEWPCPLFRGRIKYTSTVALHLTLNISETIRDGGLVPKDY